MAIIYLDWNVFVGLREGRIDGALAEVLRRLRNSQLAIVPYTIEHVLEAARGLGGGVDAPTELERRLTHLSDLTGDVYWSLEPVSGANVFCGCIPADLHADIFCDLLHGSAESPNGDRRRELESLEAESAGLVRSLNARIHALMSMYRIDLSDLLLENAPRTWADLFSALQRLSEAERRASRTTKGGPLGFDPVRLNSPGPGTRVIDLIQSQILAKEGVDLESLMVANEQKFGGSGSSRPAQLNAVLQLAGFARDRRGKRSDNLSSDSNHLNFGMRAHVFISGDKSLARRAKIVAEFEGARTLILSPEEALPILCSALPDDPNNVHHHDHF